MNISISYDNQPLDSEEQLWTITFDGKDMNTYCEFMDEDDMKEAIELMRSALNILEGKIG